MPLSGQYSRFFFNEGSGLVIVDHGQTSDEDDTPPIGDLDPLIGAVSDNWSYDSGNYFTPRNDIKYGNFDSSLDDLFDLDQGGGLLIALGCKVDTMPASTERIFTWGSRSSDGFIRLLVNSSRFTLSMRQVDGTEFTVTSATGASNYTGKDLIILITIDVDAEYPSAMLSIIDRTDSKTGGSLGQEAPLILDGTGWPSIDNNSDFGLYFFTQAWTQAEGSGSQTGMNTASDFRLRDMIIRRYEPEEELYKIRGRCEGELQVNYEAYLERIFLGIY